MASLGPGARHVPAPPSPWSDAASGHDTDSSGAFPRGKRKYSHTTVAQRQCLLEWLELPGNFELLTTPMRVQRRGDAATSSARKRVKKMDGYRALAQHMNRVAHTKWTEKTARSRFESFLAAYRKTKRQRPEDRPAFFQRVDALFGPEGERDRSRGRSESLDQRSDASRSPLVSKKDHETGSVDRSVATSEAKQEEAARDVPTLSSSSSPLRPKASVHSGYETVDRTSRPSSPVLQEGIPTSGANDETLKLQRQRVALRQQELELRQLELQTRQEENRQKLRADVLTRLVEAGKSPAEVREYLALMDPVDNVPSTCRR